MITKCPKCETAFNARKEQLSAANGLVRCGSCMSVFNALSEFSKSTQEPSATTQPPKHKPATTTTTQKNISSQPKPSKSSIANTPADTPITDTRGSKKENWSGAMHANLQSIDDDLDKLEQEIKPLKQKATASASNQNTAIKIQEPALLPSISEIEKNEAIIEELSDSFKDLDTKHSHNDPFLLETGTINPTPITEDEESWAEQLLDELDENDTTVKPFANLELEGTSKNPTVRPTLKQSVTFDTSRLDQDIADFFDSSDTIKDNNTFKQEAKPKKPKKPKKEHSNLHQLNDDPLDSHRDNKQTKKTLGYFVVFLLVLCTIAIQYLYYHFDELAQEKFWRPKLAIVCQYMGCKLKGSTNPKQIKTVSVSMREHPSRAKFLSVDAIIYSLAEVPVPFPDLILRFTDNQGQSANEYSITPAVYRKGDLLQYDTLPPEKNIQINFEIEDPGLTNYSLNFKYSP